MSRPLRDALGRWATGVVIVTGRDGNGAHYGMTVNSFASVSLDPALVLWSIQRSCEYADVFESGYCVSVLGEHQSDMVWQFTQGDQNERFAGVETRELTSGRRALAGALAYFDCDLHQRVVAGDHDVLIGHVTEFDTQDGQPVLFNQGQLGKVAV